MRIARRSDGRREMTVSRWGSAREAVYGAQKSESTGAYVTRSLLNLRECLDDGALFALLLAPLVASGMLHDTLRRLDDAVPSLRPRAWNIEPPMVLPSTPMHSSLASTPTIKALSALATSRRNLVQLFSLCSFVLLVHLARSLYLEIKLNKTRTTVAVAMERENSEPRLSVGGTGVFWLKRGEWRRTRSVVGFAFLVTAGCIVVKIATAVIGHGVWSGEFS